MTKWIIGFGTPSDMPGPGCADNDFLREEEFEGTESEADAERRRISYEEYFGDAHSWIERVEEKVEPKHRLVLISGPSGVGKGPMIEWTKNLYLQNLCQVKVRKTKTERHTGNEDDLGFGGIDMTGCSYLPFNCRGVEQRIYTSELDIALKVNKVVLIESYHTTHDFLKDKYGTFSDFTSVFVSPLDIDEIKELRTQGKRLEDYLPDLMLDSLVRRAEKDGKVFTRALTKELEKRAGDSITEMKEAHKYSLVLSNHCYESDSRWKSPILVGEPRTVVNALQEIITTGYSGYAIKGKDFDIA